MEKILVSSEGNRVWKNTFAPKIKNEYIGLKTLLTGLQYNGIDLDDAPQGLKEEYHKWDKKRRAEIAASNGEE